MTSQKLPGFVNLIEPGRLPNMTKLWRPLIPNYKDNYLTPEQLKLAVFKSARIQKLIEEMSNNSPKERRQVEQKVREMLDEIGLARNVTVVRWLGLIINRVVQRICTGVYVNEESLNNVKREVGRQPVLYLPSHRSYGDFILMSYVCFAYDLEIPGIAAGMDFYAMIGLGTMLRKTGAFFMRRSFANDKLYWHVFKEYMHALVTVYHTGIEFFVEGTRSRSGKALTPKIGLLSMSLEPLFMGEVCDLQIIPVGFAYEKPMEEKLFAYELLGVPKPKESTLGFVKALNILDQNHGAMYVNFGKPISAANYFRGRDFNRFKHAQIPAHLQELDREELKQINELAYTVVHNQQELIVISIFNLIALHYNWKMFCGNKTTVHECTLSVLEISNMLRSLGAIVDIHHKDAHLKVLESLDIHSNILQLNSNSQLELLKPPIDLQGATKFKAHSLSENTMRNVLPAISLQLYINPCLFWVSYPALITLALMRLQKNQNIVDLNVLKTEMSVLRNIFGAEFVYHSSREDLDFEKYISFLVAKNVVELISETSIALLPANNVSSILLSVVAPYMSSYFHVCHTVTLEFMNVPEFSEHELLVALQRRIELELCSQNILVHPYSLALDSAIVALGAFTQMMVLTRTRKNGMSQYVANRDNIITIKYLLDEYCQLLPFTTLNSYLIFAKM